MVSSQLNYHIIMLTSLLPNTLSLQTAFVLYQEGYHESFCTSARLQDCWGMTKSVVKLTGSGGDQVHLSQVTDWPLAPSSGGEVRLLSLTQR
jgi:hypothetical protein